MTRPAPKTILALVLVAVILTACAPSTPPAPTVDANALQTQAFESVYAGLTQTAAAIPTLTATPTLAPTAIRTPPALPGGFTTTVLNPLDTPHTYIPDSCQALKSKWTPGNAVPGTVVMVIMIHGLSKGPPPQSYDMTLEDFKNLMSDLHDQGFTAINTQQLFDFLDHNAKIPERSALLLQDDRKTAQNFNDAFRPYWKKWGWPVVNAWVNVKDSIYTLRIQENVDLENEGWVDHQSHGVLHFPIGPGSSDDFIHTELYGSMQTMQTDFKKTPIAYIWAGGGFTPKSVQMAREAGYKLGFTDSPRGPLMFNWVPQLDQFDSGRPLGIAEGPAGDPLMTLPRYWDTDARFHLDAVRKIGKDAIAYAQANKATELEYYDIVCAPKYGAITNP